jgi:transposase InsO family protein
MKERMTMIAEYLSGGYSISELARRRNVSRKTAYKWIERYENEAADGLKDRSPAPHHHPNSLSEEMEQRILELKAKWPLWGAPKIHAQLAAYADCPAESTVSNVLGRHGLSRKIRQRRRATPSEQPFEHCEQVNQVWCADFKGWFRTGDGRRCDPLTISDAHSRYLLCCQGLGASTGVLTVRPLFEATFRQYGLPEAIRTDNGAPFASVGLGGLSALSVWWLRLGIGLERIEPGQPQQNGRHERMHRTLKEATANPPRSNLRTQQKAFDVFRYEYNQQRPHEALGQKPPASLYVPSKRDYPPRLAEPLYADHWHKRKVSVGGQIRWRSYKVYLNEALIGQTVGLEPIGDGLWTIHFSTLELGQFDERRQRVLPLRTLKLKTKP